MNADLTSERRSAELVLLAGILILTIVLRFYRLGDWNFEATEMFTLRDSVRPQFHNPRPLGYLLNYFLVRPLHPLDEFGLRVMSAIVGVLTIPAFYAVARRLTGTRAALFATGFLAVSPLHVFYSQFARYWALVFLFSAVYPYALYLGVRDRRPGMIALGVVTLILAVLSHPVAAILIGGPALWLLAAYARPHVLREAWRRPAFRWGVLGATIVVVLLALRLVPLLQGWIRMHDKNPGMGQFLLGPKWANGTKQAVLMMAYLESLTFPVALAAIAGVYLLWRQRDRTLGVYLTSLAVFQLAFIALVSARSPVSTYYLVPAAPAFYLAAGVFFDRLCEVDWRLRARWIMPAVITAAFLSAGLPTLISQYRNGRRYDFRGVAQWLTPQLTAGDVVFSDQPMVLAHYLKGVEVQKLRANPAALRDSLADLERSGGGNTLWIVAPAPGHAFRTNLKAGGLADWLYGNCQLRNTVGWGRIDFRQQYLQVFRCPPSRGSSMVAAAGRALTPTTPP
jgi:4-amino-4-deoxy-L-arabinose transferase-like glycosyltransferase